MRSFLLPGIFSALLLSALPAAAEPRPGSRAAVLTQVENSMLVTGKLHIEADGSVSDVLLDKPELLPRGVVSLVERDAALWRFEPVLVDGQARSVETPMSLRVVARQRDEDSFEIGIRSVSFDHYDESDSSRVTSRNITPPRYPEDAYRAGVTGEVFLMLKINREGQVDDVIAEQVNLGIADQEVVMQRYRDLFSRRSIAAARRWSYNIPSSGEQADQPYWTVRVPVSFALHGQNISADQNYGKWKRYVPGPRQAAAWQDVVDAPSFSPDSLGDGVHMVGSSKAPKLLTPLGAI